MHLTGLIIVLCAVQMCVVTAGNDLSSLLHGKKNVIYLNENAMQTIRLKSILNLHGQNLSSSSRSQKLFWSFKRIYSIPNMYETNINDVNNLVVRTTSEMSQNEIMISLDAEVQDNLKTKYSVSEGSENNNGDNDDNANISDKFDLIIYNLTYADSGLYKCNLWNQKTLYYHLTVSSSILKPDLKIEHSAPKINSLPDNMFLESSNLVLKCVSRYAYPYPVIKWFRNNIELIPNENRISLKLADKETNAIESTLTLKNLNSSLNSNNLTCKLVQVQQDLTESAAFLLSNERKSEAVTEDKYFNEQQLWQTSDPLVLNIAFKPIISLDGVRANNTLPVSFASLDEIGPYRTIQINETNGKLVLYENDPNVLFYCLFKSNPSDSVSVVWKLNGRVQNQTSVINREMFIWDRRGRQAEAAVSSAKDQAELVCEVENKVGLSAYKVDLSLVHEPRIKLDRPVYEVDEQSNFQLNCLTDASPAPVTTLWRLYKANNTATPNYTVITSSSLLEFKSIKYTDNAGVYSCVSTNEMVDSFGVRRSGEAKFDVEINVRFKPQMNTLYKKVAVSVSDSTSTKISCITMANPEPIFNWFREGVRLGGQDNPNANAKYLTGEVMVKSKNLYESVLTVNSVDETDLNRKYVCETVNALGASQIEIELVPRSKPERPCDLRVIRTDFMTLTVAWTAGFDGGSDQTFVLQLNDSFVELDSHRSVFVVANDSSISAPFTVLKYGQGLINITNLNYDSVYTLRLMAKNELGSSDWSEFVVARTRDIDNTSAEALATFDTLFLNVPKNRLEFTFKQPPQEASDQTDSNINQSVLPSIYSLIPVCLNMSVVLYKPNANNQNQFNFKQCVSISDYLSRQQFQFDGLSDSELEMATNIDQEIFNPKSVRSMRAAICFRLKPSVCAKSTAAIIDTYNKISHSSLMASKSAEGSSDSTTTGDSFFDSFNLSHKIKSFISTNSTIPITLIVSICVCILTLLIVLFVTIIFCMRKRNFKMCKNLISQVDQKNKAASGGGQNDPNANNRNPPGNDKLTDGKLSQTNKTFDVGCISAPLGASSGSLNGSSQLTNSTNSDINPTMNTFSSTNQQQQQQNNGNKKRTFTAALTATANNIISNSIGKYKINEILVTEDEEQQQQRVNNKNAKQLAVGAAAIAAARKQQQQRLQQQDNEFTVDGMELNGHDLDTEIKLDPRNMLQTTANSSNTPSTAISNCSSNSNNTGNFMFDQHDHHHQLQHHLNQQQQQQHQHLTQHQLDMYNKGMTLIDTFNSGSSTNSASNSDPVAINNSLSSNSTAESPTYGYNVTSGATLNMHGVAPPVTHFNNSADHDNFFYIKANLSQQSQYQQQQQQNYVQIVDEDSYMKTHHVKHQPSARSKSNQSGVANRNNLNVNVSNNSSNFAEPPESGYSTPSRHKKVVYEVIV